MPRKAASAQTDPQQANFVFQGTVTKAKATTMAEVPATARTVIVRVNRLIQAPEAVSDYAGREITVQLEPSEKVKPGQSYVFHTHGWVFGDGLAVKSVKHEEASPSSVAALSTHPDDPVETLQMKSARNQVEAADLVVSGRVGAVRLSDTESKARATAMGSGRTTERISEHAPLWQEAVIHIDDVYKGQHSKKQVTVRFPASTDVRWRNAPKFHTGQEGVFILHKEQMKNVQTAEAVPALRREEYTALHAADFQPLDRLPHLV
jgi:hypothetical protein